MTIEKDNSQSLRRLQCISYIAVDLSNITALLQALVPIVSKYEKEAICEVAANIYNALVVWIEANPKVRLFQFE